MRLIQRGPRDADLVVVGEAPGKKEMERGEPFIGWSGQVLGEKFQRIGVDFFRDVFVTNVVHDMPPAGEIDRWASNRKPDPRYVMGLVQLQVDLKAVRPKMIVCFGAHALRAVTLKPAAIYKYRGSILESKLVPGIKTIATIHPAATMHGPAGGHIMALIDFDFIRIGEEIKFPEIRLPQREHLLNPDPLTRMRVAQEMAQAEWLSIDIETYDAPGGRYRIACVGFSDRPDRGMVIPWYGASEIQIIRWLCSCPAAKIMQNGNFDTMVLEDNGIEVVNFAWDTMCGHHAIYPEAASGDEMAALAGKKTSSPFRKGLAFQTSIYTKEPYYKDDGKVWQESGDINEFWLYNSKDACVTREIRDVQSIELVNPEFFVKPVFDRKMRALHVARKLSRRGVPVDRAKMVFYRDQLEGEIQNLHKALNAMAGREVNVKSSKDMQWFLYDKMGLPMQYAKRKGGKRTITADKTAINKLAQTYQNPGLLVILEIRERRDIMERYLAVNIDSDDRYRYMYDVTGTNTHRLSSRMTIYGTGGNIQNQPRKYRDIFISHPQYVFWQVDYSQAEARVVAWLAECERLIQLFLSGKDIHAENAAQFFKIALDLVSFYQRYCAKRIVHASNYGMGLDKLITVVNNDARDTGMTIDRATAAIGQQAYFMLYPEIKSVYWREVEEALRQTRTLVTPKPFEARRQFFGKPDHTFLNSAYAFIPQSVVGEMGIEAMSRVEEANIEGCELLLNGHDSLAGQCRDDASTIERVTKTVQELMTIPLEIKGRELVIPTDVELGFNWGKYHEEKNPRGLRDAKKFFKEAA